MINVIITDSNIKPIMGFAKENNLLIDLILELENKTTLKDKQIAEVLGTSQTMYARYERGANELPIHHLITLSKYYGVSTDYLLGLSKER